MAGRKPTPSSKLALRGSRHARNKSVRPLPDTIHHKPIKAKADYNVLLKMIPGFNPFLTCGDCKFKKKLADKALEFFHNELVFIEGEKAGKPFALELWQAAIVANLFGWVKPDGTRRFREAFIAVPRKNGKSPLLAGIIDYMAFCDGEPGAQIYSAAADREQASLIFRHAAGMIMRNENLQARSRIYRSYKAIEFPETDGIFKSLSADAETKHGLNSHAVAIDELHAQPNRDLVDVLTTSTGSRRQPLIVHITTAGYDRNSICFEKYDYACKVRDGIFEDNSFLPVIYEALETDQWDSEEVWHKANPNLGVSVSLDYLRRECQRAKDSPAYENTFRRLHLNQWTQSDVRFLGGDTWNNCGEKWQPSMTETGQIAYAGLDLSSTTDISAFVLAIPQSSGGYAVKPYCWLPAENAHKREIKDRVPYETWARQGHIELTPGKVIDYDVIRRRINEIGEQYNIKQIAVDRWNATQLITQLQGDGFDIVAFGQGFASMSAPTKELEKLVVGGQLYHPNHPVLNWCAANLSVEIDAAGNFKPSKAKSTERIDLMVALTMALGVAASAEIPSASVYETRGVFSI